MASREVRFDSSAVWSEGAGYVTRRFVDSIAEVGAITRFLSRLLRVIHRKPAGGRSLLVQQMVAIGIDSVPLVLITSLFVGAVAAVQAAYQFQNYIPLRYIATVIGKSVVIELGPVLTALVVAGRVGASIAAELGTMRVTEQVDAMEAMAIDPMAYLVVPRVLGAVIMLPVVTIFSDALAIFGAFVVTTASMGVSSQEFALGLRLFFAAHDVLGGLVKSVVFGFLIAGMGCYYGFRTTGGAEGVGRATTKAVVSSSVLILITDYILASVIFRAIFGG
jgi:phospholipid/cholesterol/gamma-HCH transport system permease protein